MDEANQGSDISVVDPDSGSESPDIYGPAPQLQNVELETSETHSQADSSRGDPVADASRGAPTGDSGSGVPTAESSRGDPTADSSRGAPLETVEIANLQLKAVEVSLVDQIEPQNNPCLMHGGRSLYVLVYSERVARC